MGHGRTCLSALVVSLLVSGTELRSDEAIAESPPEQFPHHIVALTTSQNLLATDPDAIARFLKPARSAPVTSEDKARALSTLPLEGDVTCTQSSDQISVPVGGAPLRNRLSLSKNGLRMRPASATSRLVQRGSARQNEGLADVREGDTLPCLERLLFLLTASRGQ